MKQAKFNLLRLIILTVGAIAKRTLWLILSIFIWINLWNFSGAMPLSEGVYHGYRFAYTLKE